MGTHTTTAGTPFTVASFTPPGGHQSVYGIPDSRIGQAETPTILYCHGAEGAYNQFTESRWINFRYALMDAGWAFIEGSGAGNNWGNQAGIDSYKTTYNHAAANYINVGKLVVLGRSMGGLAGTHLAVKDPDMAPLVDGLIVNSGVQNLYDIMRDPRGSGQVAGEAGRLAYGIAPDWSDYATKTAGYDPFLFDPALYSGKQVFWTVGDADPVVPGWVHGIAQRDRVSAQTAYSYLDVKVGGDHNSGTGTYDQVTQMMAFLEVVQGKTPGKIVDVKANSGGSTLNVRQIVARSAGVRSNINQAKLKIR